MKYTTKHLGQNIVTKWLLYCQIGFSIDNGWWCSSTQAACLPSESSYLPATSTEERCFTSGWGTSSSGILGLGSGFCLGHGLPGGQVGSLCLGQCSPGLHGWSNPLGWAYAKAKRLKKIHFIVCSTTTSKTDLNQWKSLIFYRMCVLVFFRAISNFRKSPS